jgi:hypothetical protein
LPTPEEHRRIIHLINPEVNENENNHVRQGAGGVRVYSCSRARLGTERQSDVTETKTVVHDFHKVNLALMNLGPNAISPQAAAYAMNELVRPATVIASHPNEGVTSGGKLIANTRTAAFVNLIKGRAAYLALSGRTLEFDGNAKCVAGC